MGTQDDMDNPVFDQIVSGMKVYDAQGNKLGEVDRLQGDSLVMRKGLIFTEDVLVPLAAIRSVSPEGVQLKVGKQQVEQKDWSTLETTGITGTERMISTTPPEQQVPQDMPDSSDLAQ